MIVNDKVFVVTGAGNGIGRAVVLKLLSKGAKVFGLDISESGLEETKIETGENEKSFKYKVLDVTNREEVSKLPEEVISAFGQVDGLLNIAGVVQKFIPINDMELKDMDRIMDINFFGPVTLTKAFLPYFLKKDTVTNITNVSSMGGLVPFPRQSVYGATKAALKLFTEGLYAEMRDTNVKVCIVFPGAVKTNITQNSATDMKVDANSSTVKMTSPETAANIIVKGIEKDKLRVIVGKDCKMISRLSRLAPTGTINLMQSQAKKYFKD